MVEYHCAICRFPQAAPTHEAVDYECPRCKWRYKVYGDMLVVWDHSALGVNTPALAPGEEPPDNVIDQSIFDPEEASAAREKSTAEWAGGKNEDWGKSTKVIVPKGNSDEEPGK